MTDILTFRIKVVSYRTMSNLEITHEDSPVLMAVKEQLDALPNPKSGQRNVKHFVLSDGKVVVKAAPWIDPLTGFQIAEIPDWVRFFPDNTAVSRANFVANLPDPEQKKNKYRSGLVKNPLTGEIVRKDLPWLDHGIVLENYVPEIQVSEGRKIVFANSGWEFDDPTDPENLRFFEWGDINHRVISDIFRRIDDDQKESDWTKRVGIILARKKMDGPLKDVGIIGIGLGGTIMMEHNSGVLVPTGTIEKHFEKHVEHAMPNCMVRSFSFPRAKNTMDAEGAYGVDSSQLEIDFIADVAIAMTCAWNELNEQERRAFAGFVVATGTDTCVEAITLLKLMLGPNCPFSVIAVAAMKPMEDEGSDGLENFRNAFQDLLKLRDRKLKVVGLRVDGGLFNPTKTRKFDDKLSEKPTFQGEKYIDSIRRETAKTADEKTFQKVNDEDFGKPFTEAMVFRGTDEVLFVNSSMSKDPFRLAKSVRESDTKAILVETYASCTQAMKDLAAILSGANGRPIFYVNQVLGGSVNQSYEVAHELSRRGIHLIGMTEEAARAKINLAIRLFGNDSEKIVNFVTGTNYIGEQPGDFSEEQMGKPSASVKMGESEPNVEVVAEQTRKGVADGILEKI